jgi:hypothetical protein
MTYAEPVECAPATSPRTPAGNESVAGGSMDDANWAAMRGLAIVMAMLVVVSTTLAFGSALLG